MAVAVTVIVLAVAPIVVNAALRDDGSVPVPAQTGEPTTPPPSTPAPTPSTRSRPAPPRPRARPRRTAGSVGHSCSAHR
ncbi:hypothetical protein NKG94_40245 [Micromonospora sp. M12]